MVQEFRPGSVGDSFISHSRRAGLEGLCGLHSSLETWWGQVKDGVQLRLYWKLPKWPSPSSQIPHVVAQVFRSVPREPKKAYKASYDLAFFNSPRISLLLPSIVKQPSMASLDSRRGEFAPPLNGKIRNGFLAIFNLSQPLDNMFFSILNTKWWQGSCICSALHSKCHLRT